MAKKSVIIDFLNGYESDGHGSSKRFFSRSVSGRVTASNRSLLSRSVRLGNRITEAIGFTASQAYGIGFLVYGLLTFVCYFLNDYFSISSADGSYAMLIGIVSALISVPLLFSDKPLALQVQGNRVMEFVVFEFFCIKRPHKTEQTRPLPAFVPGVVGAILGALGLCVPAYTVVGVFIGLIVAYLTLLSPEFSFILSLMVLPYLGLIPYSSTLFVVLVGLNFVSFIRKVACGKRALFFEQYDLVIALMLIAILISGIFIKGVESFTSSVVMIVTALGYMLAGNLITNRRIADCALNALTISSIPVSVYSVYTFVYIMVNGKFEELEGGVRSTFDSASSAAIFLLVGVAVSLALAKQANGAPRVAYSVAFVLNLVALCLTFEMFSLVAVALGALAYLIQKTKIWSLPLLLVATLIPYSLFYIPASVVEWASQLIPGIKVVSELPVLWNKCLLAFRDNIFFGIGMGEESFVTEMKGYGVSGFNSSENIFVELALEAGVFALVFFVVALFIRARHSAVYQGYLKHSQMSVSAPFILALCFALIGYGATEYIFADSPSFYLFWCVFGIGSAVLRVAKRELDDRTQYYEDTRDTDYSAIDIDIS